jgi:hypothetical protein
MKNGNLKTAKPKKPKYSIKDYQDDNVVFDKQTEKRIKATIAVLKAIGEQEKLKQNGSFSNLESGI